MNAQSRPTGRRPPIGFLAAATMTLLLLAVVPALGQSGPEGASARPAGSVDFVNLSATGNIAFVPSTFQVNPGDSVHLRVTQEANFNHTFTLSSVANASLPSTDTTSDLYAYFNAHPPLVNLSLGLVVGKSFYANFTAPSAGTYEFVCEIPTHFNQFGMHGTMVSGTPSTSSSGPGFFTTTNIVILVVVVILIIAVVAAVAMRKKPATKAPPETPPTTPP